jgi:REP element-mobilizing transposase RayT
LGSGFEKQNHMRSQSLSSLVAGFKPPVKIKINEIRNTPGKKVWQRSFYDRVIRDEDELNRIREYIINNPLKWETDRNNPDILK